MQKKNKHSDPKWLKNQNVILLENKAKPPTKKNLSSIFNTIQAAMKKVNYLPGRLSNSTLFYTHLGPEASTGLLSHLPKIR